MKRAIGLLVLAVVLAGCSGVVMNAKYATLLDKTCALSAQTAQLADSNQLTPDQMKSALRGQAQTWKLFVYARDGKDANGVRP